MTTRSDLASVASEILVLLTTKGRRTGKLHVTMLWFAAHGGKVYLSHEGKETDWMKNIRKNDQAYFEIGGKRFAGEARYLEDRTAEATIAKVALYQKYYGRASREVIEDWFSLSKLLVIEV